MLIRTGTMGLAAIAVGLIVFLGAKSLVITLDDDSAAGEHLRPRIVGIAAAPSPVPPEWPAPADTVDAAEGLPASGGAGTVEPIPAQSDEVEPVLPSAGEGEVPSDDEASPSKPPPSGSGADGGSGGKAGSGWETEGTVGG